MYDSRYFLFTAKSDSVRSDHFFMLWIIAAIISTCYTLTWDIKMDWGLLDKKSGENIFLREETVYRSKVSWKFLDWVYGCRIEHQQRWLLNTDCNHSLQRS